MGDIIEKLKWELRESQESQKRLLKRVTELEKQLQNLEFHHRTMNQLLSSIIDMDAASGGDRSSLRRRINILFFIDDHLYDMGENSSELTLHDILESLIVSPQEFNLPSQGIHVSSFFDKAEEAQWNNTLDTHMVLILAICIADIFAGLFSISDRIYMEAHHLHVKDRLRLRCQTGTSSRSAEEILNQLLQGAFFSLLQDRISITFLPPNPMEGPGLEMDISYDEDRY